MKLWRCCGGYDMGDAGPASRFHGKDPSKNKQEKRLRKIQEEMEQKRLASSEQPEHSSLKRLHAIQVSPLSLLSCTRTALPLWPHPEILLHLFEKLTRFLSTIGIDPNCMFGGRCIPSLFR
jgi:hypothetical protein